MAENLLVEAIDKIGKYQELIPKLKELINLESDLIANLGNISSALKTVFGWLWVGFYLVKDKDLVLGPFQGPIACSRINYGRGVCGKSWQLGKSLIVPDVEQFTDHIACSSLAKSEIVVPIFDQGNNIVGVLDIDSIILDEFNNIDEKYLTEIVKLVKF